MKDSSSQFMTTQVVDIGSGLGHLPNSLAAIVIQNRPSDRLPIRIYAIDCDPALDQKARLTLERFAQDSNVNLQSRARIVRRVLFRLTEPNVTEFMHL
ncbi:unnamed protein product [Echinostoma caproni]|uniref:Methyltranfer_dom domain-containing protein n=1 Tax=Echinostoma caproni TaxID=27848 RepID=A0A183B147_9TREM|nr:unnamed protein product [Echinostoma caproni]